MKEITEKADLIFLIERFYDKLLADDAVSHFFKELDLAEHIPKVADFWGFVLLDETGYSTNVISKHAQLALEPAHFQIWLKHFKDTLNEHFTGEKVAIASQRADLIAWTMENKMNGNKA